VEWWILYKEGNKLYIQNEMLFGEVYQKLVGDKIFNAQTCYNFIEPRKTYSEEGDKISEWSIDIADLN
jgi:hypothetical protein